MQKHNETEKAEEKNEKLELDKTKKIRTGVRGGVAKSGWRVSV